MKSILIYTVHKAASMFLHKLAKDVSSELHINYYSINDGTYREAVRGTSWKTFIEEMQPGCFAPIRAGEANPIFPDNLDEYSIILQLRDPRDVLTSHFFWFHREKELNPTGEGPQKWIDTGIDEFVLARTQKFKTRYIDLIGELLDRKNVTFVKYEQMAQDYPTWLSTFIGAFKDCPAPAKRTFGLFKTENSLQDIESRLLCRYRGDFKTEKENPQEHKRQISPGDHKFKLTPETISALNQDFGEILTRLNYHL